MEGLSRVLGGVLLVAGTTIGAAMLVLPVTTGLAGFLPACALMVAFWLFMTFSAFCFLEVTQWIPTDTDIISMAGKTLGRWGQGVTWVAYLFLLYALITAYLALSAPIFLEALSFIPLPAWTGPLPLILFFSVLIYCGTGAVDHLNRLLMFCLCASYVVLVGLVAPHVSPENLTHTDWGKIGYGLPVIATAFGYHIIIPSLHTYMGRDSGKMVWVLLLGGLVPLLVNLVWEVLALGALPLATLQEGFSASVSSAYLLKDLLVNPWIGWAAKGFSFFAITTSILGVSLSLAHFLADGLSIPRTPIGRVGILTLTFVPPLALVVMDPSVSFRALDYAGVIGVVFLLGVMPMLMVWGGRYRRGFGGQSFRVIGGKPLLIFGLGLGCSFLVYEILIQVGVL